MTFPFAAIVGQDEMKRAMILTAVDAKIGGVLVFGDRGTGKSTAVPKRCRTRGVPVARLSSSSCGP